MAGCMCGISWSRYTASIQSAFPFSDASEASVSIYKVAAMTGRKFFVGREFFRHDLSGHVNLGDPQNGAELFDCCAGGNWKCVRLCFYSSKSLLFIDLYFRH